eukprot:CAMPEP_0184693402 /NCGR_PEP_ID=MMETSP0313-20130426/1638_1 /TAXON_ID=2792 /ORGANISM="Porphyridium aerugineum, Strain SAG 1380-2" /LENGTH=254 /DNA_ID=CAMNT_0027151477 /DNA_START=277 /DNA_END=1041 /DNA_ORIENTATION=-
MEVNGGPTVSSKTNATSAPVEKTAAVASAVMAASSTTPNSAAMLQDWMLGVPVRVKTVDGNVYQGLIFTYDMDLNCVVLLQEPAGSTPAASPKTFASRDGAGGASSSDLPSLDTIILRASSLVEVKALDVKKEGFAAPNASKVADHLKTTSLPPMNWEKIREKEEESAFVLRQYQRKHDIGVPYRGSEVFRALSKTYRCEWGAADTILVLDKTLRLYPPYRPEDLRANGPDSSSALDRVKLVLEKERAKIFGKP